jgi:predicted nucleic acid-binding protein
MMFVDANVILDIWDRDPAWYAWSIDQLRRQSILHELVINPIVYSEISVSFESPTGLDAKLEDLQVAVLSIPRRAAFMAGKAYQQYRRRGGAKSNVLPDFFIGAHAAVLDCALLTRDVRYYAAYFPTVPLIAP